METSDLLYAIDLLYSSILDEQAFPHALREESEIAGGREAHHSRFDRSTGKAVAASSLGSNCATQAEYLHRSRGEDVRVPAALNGPVRALAAEHQASLVPHFERALRIREAFQAVRGAELAYREVVDRLPFGVVMLDSRGAATDFSRTAEELFRTSGALQRQGPRLHATRADEDGPLQRAIRAAMSIDLVHPARVDGTITVHDLARRRSLRVRVFPVSTPHPFMNKMAACTLLLFGSGTRCSPSLDTIMHVLHVTLAEARLARELVQGVTLREAAQALDLSINTCKTQLKSIYARTGCRSQVELAKALLMSGIAQTLIAADPGRWTNGRTHVGR